MKKLFAATGTSLLVAGLMSVAPAAPAKHAAPAKAPAKHTMSKMSAKPKITQASGTVVSMTKTSLTIRPTQNKKMGASKTVAIPKSAKVWIGSKASKLSALKPSQHVTISMRNGTVTSVRASAMSVHSTSSHKPASRKAMTHKTSAMHSTKAPTAKSLSAMKHK